MCRNYLATWFVYMRQLLTHAVSALLGCRDSPNDDGYRPVNTAFECHPIRSLKEMLAVHNTPIAWHSLVEPLDPTVRAAPRQLGADFENFDSVPASQWDDSTRPRVLVCHDLAGNYRGDRFINDSPKWDDYRFYQWSGIDEFCYFSHDFVTIPPLGWLQAAHRHGVRVLGTVITESTGILEAILADDMVLDAAVDALVHLAVHLRFEGWLLNIECALHANRLPRLITFVRLLHDRMHQRVPHACVIWYDSILASSGALNWQNELNAHNRVFYDACDGIFLNYSWKDGHLRRTVQQVGDDATLLARVYVGIDVFGRGQVAGFRTAETLAQIRRASEHFSVALFAPGWTFEEARKLDVDIYTPNGTDECNAFFMERNARFWDSLWPMLHSSGPARLPFGSTFCVGSGKQRHQDGVLCRPVAGWFNLTRQSWQPSVAAGSTWQLQFAEAFSGGACLEVHARHGVGDVRRLFVTDFGGDDVRGGVIVSYAFKSFGSGGGDDDTVAVWLRMRAQDAGRVCRVECGGGMAMTEGDGDAVGGGAVRLRPLVGDDLRVVLIHIAQRRETRLPVTMPMRGDGELEATGWLVRYYYVAFGGDVANHVRVTDVGVSAADRVYLGALHVHRGAETLWRQHWRVITDADFH